MKYSGRVGDNLFFCEKWTIIDELGKIHRTHDLIVYQEISRIYLDEYAERE